MGTLIALRFDGSGSGATSMSAKTKIGSSANVIGFGAAMGAEGRDAGGRSTTTAGSGAGEGLVTNPIKMAAPRTAPARHVNCFTIDPP